MEFVFILAVILLQIFLVNFLQVMEIVRTLRIYTFMENEVFPFYFEYKRFAAMRAAESELFEEAVFFRGEVGAVDFTVEPSGFSLLR